MFARSAGLLLHVTSLPGGRLGPEAYRFVDFLAAAGQSWWQVLPVGPPGEARSPYKSLSAFAGDEALLERPPREGPGLAAPWVEDYALFRTLRAALRRPWNEWPRGLRNRDARALARARKEHATAIARHARLQRAFDEEWKALRRYANERGVRLIGDLPIYVAQDSADVWARREIFKLDRGGRPRVVTGVPPDYFAKHGQRWGNPHYRWDVMRRRGFAWWISRLRRMFELFDAVRIDHFLGFVRAWEIPARARTARRGKWVPGPGAAFFTAVQKALGAAPLIAEDLGLVTAEATALRERFGLPGIRVLHFGFGGDPTERPHYVPRNCVVYTGTHDNDTTQGWFAAGGPERERARRYAGVKPSDIHWGLIRVAHLSAADVAIVPVQDLLGLGSEARMNHPGRARGNWRWRLRGGELTPRLAHRLREITETADR